MSIISGKMFLNPFKKSPIAEDPAMRQYYQMVGQQLDQYGRLFAPIRAYYANRLQADKGAIEQQPIGQATAAARAQASSGLTGVAQGAGMGLASGHGIGGLNQYAAQAAEKAGVLGAQGAVSGQAAYIGGLQNVLQSALSQQNMALRAQASAAGIGQAYQQQAIGQGLGQAAGIGQAAGLLSSLAGAYYGWPKSGAG